MIQMDERIINPEELLKKVRIKVLNKGLECNEFTFDNGNVQHLAIISRLRTDTNILDQTWNISDSEIKTGFIRRMIKRIIRKSVYWLIRPYWDQQIAYNAAATRAIEDMIKLHEIYIAKK